MRDRCNCFFLLQGYLCCLCTLNKNRKRGKAQRDGSPLVGSDASAATYRMLLT